MSVYIATGPEAASFVASNRGWGQLCDWAETLDDAPALMHLTVHGWTDDVGDLAKELEALLASADDDVKGVAETLLVLLDGAETVLVTNGLEPPTPA